MTTEAQIYREALIEVLSTLKRKITVIEFKGSLSAQDEIELAALDTLVQRIGDLESY